MGPECHTEFFYLARFDCPADCSGLRDEGARECYCALYETDLFFDGLSYYRFFVCQKPDYYYEETND